MYLFILFEFFCVLLLELNSCLVFFIFSCVCYFYFFFLGCGAGCGFVLSGCLSVEAW